MNTSDTVKYAINNILLEGLTDIFPRPFEVDILKNRVFRDKALIEVRELIDIATQDSIINLNQGLQKLKIYPITHVLYPKKEAFDFRKCALIEPLDTIEYLSLTLFLASEIEKSRVKKSENKVFSYRFKPEEGKYLFDKDYNYTSFNSFIYETIKKKSVSFLVKCDISNFYDRLNIHRLESILLSVCPSNKNVVKLINELLLFWANRDSYGLPVGSNPSRILAEAALIDVDKFLLSHKVNFCRFVDDFRLFAPNVKTAHYWLSLLVERLSIEGLFINQSKTLIEDVSDKSKFIKTEEEREVIKNEKKKDKRLVSGYSGTVPTKFRNASETEIKKIQEDKGDIVAQVESAKIIHPDEFREYCKAILYKKNYEKFRKLPSLLEKFPQFTPYVIDLIIKHKDVLPDKVKSYLKTEFSKYLTDGNYLPEYIAIAIVSLLSVDGYKDTNTLFGYFRGLRRNAGSYIGRATLESLEKIIERGQVLEIRQYYNRADLWEKRQIVKIVDKHLHKEEKNAWFKNIKMNESNDVFLVGIFSK